MSQKIKISKWKASKCRKKNVKCRKKNVAQQKVPLAITTKGETCNFKPLHMKRQRFPRPNPRGKTHKEVSTYHFGALQAETRLQLYK